MKSGIESANKEGMLSFLVSLSSYLRIFCIFSDDGVFKLLKTLTSLCWQACFQAFLFLTGPKAHVSALASRKNTVLLAGPQLTAVRLTWFLCTLSVRKQWIFGVFRQKKKRMKCLLSCFPLICALLPCRPSPCPLKTSCISMIVQNGTRLLCRKEDLFLLCLPSMQFRCHPKEVGDERPLVIANIQCTLFCLT